jgi:hypothetical protein
MSKAVTYKVNRSDRDELTLPCQSCVGKTAHKILVSVDVRGSEGDADFSFDWISEYQTVQCGGCKSISFRTESSNSEDYIYGGMDAKGNAFEGVDEALKVPGAEIRLFGKPEAFKKRRMGVALARAGDTDAARVLAKRAASLVKPVKGAD